jgi:hypothetical protein
MCVKPCYYGFQKETSFYFQEITELSLQKSMGEPKQVSQTKARPMKRTSSGDMKLDGEILEPPKLRIQPPRKVERVYII